MPWWCFQDNYEEEDNNAGSFAPPCRFTGFQPARILPDLLTQPSTDLRANGGQALREVVSDFELQAIGHDGMAANDRALP